MEHDHPCYSIKPYITWFDFFTLTFVLQRGPTVIVRLSFIAVSQCLCICYMETSHLWMADPTAISSENAPIIIQIIEISLLFLLPNELKKNTIKFRVFENTWTLCQSTFCPTFVPNLKALA